MSRIHAKVFLVVTSCSDVVRYYRFGGPCCLHLQAVGVCESQVIPYIYSKPYAFVFLQTTQKVQAFRPF